MSVYLNEWTNESLEVLYELTAWYPNSFIYSHVMKAVTCLPVHKNGRISNSVFFLLLSGGYTSHNQPIKRCLILLFQADERKRVHGTECWFEWCVRASCFPQLANYPAEKLSGKKKKKKTSMLTALPQAACVFACECVHQCVCVLGFTDWPRCECVSIKHFARGLLSLSVFWHCELRFPPSPLFYQDVWEMWGLTAAPSLWDGTSPPRGFKWSLRRASLLAATQRPAGNITAPLP